MSDEDLTRGRVACDAFSDHLVSVPLGGVICGGGLSTTWSQYSDLGKAAWEAAAEAVRDTAILECLQAVKNLADQAEGFNQTALASSYRHAEVHIRNLRRDPYK
jgi:hypothetical protein